MIYKWRTKHYKTDANEAGKELERITEKYNGLYPEDIVIESRSEDAVLHNEFEWDDEVAAEKYRREQARAIIRNIQVVFEEKETPVRAYYTLDKSQKDKNKFEPIQVILSSDEKKERLINIAMMELKMFRRKYDMIGEFIELFEKMDDLIERYAS